MTRVECQETRIECLLAEVEQLTRQNESLRAGDGQPDDDPARNALRQANAYANRHLGRASWSRKKKERRQRQHGQQG